MSATTDRVLELIEIKLKSISTYVVLAATMAAAWWTNMTPEAQAAFTAAHAVLVPIAPYFTGIAFAISAIVPQNITTAAQRKQAAFEHFLDLIFAQKASGTLPAVVAVPPGVDAAKVAAALASKSRPEIASEQAPAAEPARVSPAAAVAAQLQAIAAPGDLMAAVKTLRPDLTEEQIRAKLAAAPTAAPAFPVT